MAGAIQIIISIPTEDPNFSADDLQAETVGAISSVRNGRRWNDYGNFYIIDHTYNIDDLNSLSNGSISSITGGSGWAANGSIHLIT